MKKSLWVVSFAVAAFMVWSSYGRAAGRDGVRDHHNFAEDRFDRFDGTGESGVRVDVVEWESNLEIHVYPKGSLAGLALKLVEEQQKKIMVIGYRFSKNPAKQEIRRAILGIPMPEKFFVYEEQHKDPEYSKFVITPKAVPTSEKKFIAFRLDAEPKQLYPEGHPALGEPEAASVAGGAASPADARQPASSEKREGKSAGKKAPSDEDNEGGIRAFSF